MLHGPCTRRSLKKNENFDMVAERFAIAGLAPVMECNAPALAADRIRCSSGGQHHQGMMDPMQLHPEDPERDDGKWMRTDGNERKAGEESEESRLRQTVRYLKELDKMENKKESGKVQEVVEVAEVEVNEEEEEWMTEEESRPGDEGGDLDPKQVRQGWEEELNYMVKTLRMFEFGTWEDATSRTSKMATTTKWVDRAQKDDNGKMFVRCRLVARDLKPKRQGRRDDLLAAMPPLEAQKGLFAFVAGMREK